MMIVSRRNEEKYTNLSTPAKLHAMLDDAENLGFEDVVCWQPGGASFKVMQPERFAKEIMQSYFNQTKYKSFQRQLNIYGFKRIHVGRNMGGYVHRQFRREAPELSDFVARRPRVNQATEHAKLRNNVSTNSPMKNSAETVHKEIQGIKLEDSEVKAFYDFFYPEDPAEQASVSSIFESDDAMKEDTQFFDELASMSEIFQLDGNDWQYDRYQDKQIIPPPSSSPLSGIVQHEQESEVVVSDEVSDEEEQDELQGEHSFPWKVHMMLERAEKGNFQHIVSWVQDGSAFKVHNTALFMEKVMPNYFDQTKYESFRRQLNLYNFTRVSKGSDRGVISHPLFVEGAREQCRNIARNVS